MNRTKKICLMAVFALATSACATTPPELETPEPAIQEPEPEPVILPKPALLDNIPVFAPSPSPAAEAYHNDAHLLPLSEYKSKIKRAGEKRLPYRR